MAKFYSALTPQLRDFIREQHVFFAASAPASGRINLSPKGMDTFRILDDQRVAYLDVTGSGNETAAHLRENGRLTIMFCSFSKEPMILRLYGQGRSIKPHDGEWARMASQFFLVPGTRQVILLEIESLQTSCGWGVPRYDYRGERDVFSQWVAKKGPQGILDYWREKNQTSIDGLPTGLLETPE